MTFVIQSFQTSLGLLCAAVVCCCCPGSVFDGSGPSCVVAAYRRSRYHRGVDHRRQNSKDRQDQPGWLLERQTHCHQHRLLNSNCYPTRPRQDDARIYGPSSSARYHGYLYYGVIAPTRGREHSPRITAVSRLPSSLLHIWPL
ncbi:hypothetical protein EJ05DRAFT_137338 [Pseudovirgaria hyperparasitica]|uniref:Secreted protein n=1 Tax=Pseudovirgaria hyperparasitica TaxID=470096 RepID=A0A6A6VXE0_9PEZI|nr:uncharacterized protein EJ05DRAFT_137338 [Pseudovirgaria hyperparasitica]KAF2754893.1 hypothetical protein EJ05DRAFT_137338 [Pseudovirgaria hyperparasitica]